MSSIVVAALLAVTGIVESVRQVPMPEPLAIFEQSYRPRTVDEVVVRLDDGRAIHIRPRETQIFEPGERVLVVPDRTGVRLEHADQPSLFSS